jgi:hypothetical protein
MLQTSASVPGGICSSSATVKAPEFTKVHTGRITKSVEYDTVDYETTVPDFRVAKSVYDS